MIPSYLSEEVKSTGERQIYQYLQTDPDTSDWIVLHSLNLARHIKRKYGEIDFLVLAPNLGTFSLEVKSGRVERKDGIWVYTNRFNEQTESPRGPFEQAREGMFSLRAAIKNKFGESSSLYNSLFGFGVLFPHIHFNVSGIDFEQWQVYDMESRRSPISKYIKLLSDKTISKMGSHSSKNALPSQNDLEHLVNFLRGDFECVVPPSFMLSEAEQAINSYTSEQYACLDQLEYNPRCLFQGAAGTGKTMIALESVRRELYRGSRVLVLCFNGLLAEWLSSQVSDDGIKDNLKVSSFHAYLSEISGIHYTGEISKNDFFTFELPIRALDAINEGKVEQYDKIIIDEGQDLLIPEYLDVLDALLKGGLVGGRWEIYCDFERQIIYSELTPNEMIEILTSRSNFVRFNLTINCRNTRPIGEEISLICNLKASHYLNNKLDGLPVEYYFYDSYTDQENIIAKILTKLKSQHVPRQKITILSPIRFDKSVVSTLTKRGYKINQLNKNILRSGQVDEISFSTIHSFKGLENSYIILTDIESLSDPNMMALVYVGMSRARLGLYVLINRSAEKDYNLLISKTLKEDNFSEI